MARFIEVCLIQKIFTPYVYCGAGEAYNTWARHPWTRFEQGLPRGPDADTATLFVLYWNDLSRFTLPSHSLSSLPDKRHLDNSRVPVQQDYQSGTAQCQVEPGTVPVHRLSFLPRECFFQGETQQKSQADPEGPWGLGTFFFKIMQFSCKFEQILCNLWVFQACPSCLLTVLGTVYEPVYGPNVWFGVTFHDCAFKNMDCDVFGPIYQGPGCEGKSNCQRYDCQSQRNKARNVDVKQKQNWFQVNCWLNVVWTSTHTCTTLKVNLTYATYVTTPASFPISGAMQALGW